jgi:hypothetical protein
MMKNLSLLLSLLLLAQSIGVCSERGNGENAA